MAQRMIASDYDQFTGMTEETWYDEAEGTITLRRLQDVEHTLAMNKVMHNSHTAKKANYDDSRGLHQVARIPFAIVEKWLREDGFDWFNSTDKERKAKLNDRDNSKLLVRPGKL